MRKLAIRIEGEGDNVVAYQVLLRAEAHPHADVAAREEAHGLGRVVRQVRLTGQEPVNGGADVPWYHLAADRSRDAARL